MNNMHLTHIIEVFIFLFTNFSNGFEQYPSYKYPSGGVSMGSMHGIYSVNGTAATSFFSLQNFKSKAVWQNEIFSFVAKTQNSQAYATLKSCLHNIKADMALPL